MIDPARLAAMDQQLAGMRDVARSCAAFHRMLLAVDLPVELANSLVVSWFDELVADVLMRKRDADG